MGLAVLPMQIREANEFVQNFHRHNAPVQGAKFAIGASLDDQLWGVAIVGRPVARKLQDGFTAEVTRVCVRDGAPKGTGSFLYGRCWRIWQAMGGRRMLTYTLADESGATLRGAGWKLIGESNGKEGWLNRPGRKWQLVMGQLKFRWEAA